MKKVLKQLNKIAEFYQITLITFSEYSGATAQLEDDSIVIGYSDFTRDQVICAFFHELGHFYCMYSGKFMSFHDRKPIDECSIDELKKWVKTSLRAERYVDKIGRGLMEFYYPDTKYESGYSDEYASILHKATVQLPMLLEIRRREQLGEK